MEFKTRLLTFIGYGFSLKPPIIWIIYKVIFYVYTSSCYLQCILHILSQSFLHIEAEKELKLRKNNCILVYKTKEW